MRRMPKAIRSGAMYGRASITRFQPVLPMRTEAEGCGQQMVAKAVCLAIAVKILHGGHVAYLCRNSNAWER